MKLFIALAAALALVGCSQPDNDSASTTGSSTTSNSSTGSTGDATSNSTTGSTAPATQSAPYSPPESRAPKDGEDVAVLDTSMGKVVLMFFPDKAPNHVKNFKDLAKKGFYDGTKFHRVIPGFMIQGGDPNTKSGDPSTWGSGGPEHKVKAEFNDIHHARGILSMARSGDPDSAGSQFFIMVADNSGLDHQYSAFGQVVSGMDAVDKIVSVPVEEPGRLDRPIDPPVLKSVKIVKWPVK